MKSIKCCWHELLGWWKAPKIISGVLLIFLFVFNTLKTTRTFAEMVGIGIAPWVFPFLFTNPTCLLLIELALLFLLCDIPSSDQSQMFVLLRVGKTAWIMGQLLYLVVASLIFCLSIYAFSVICMIPYIELSSSWGKVIGTLAQTTASSQYGTLSFPYEILKTYLPVQATAISFLLLWLSEIFLGEILILLNLFVHRGIAITVASVLVLLPYLIYFNDAYVLLKFSPLSWCNLTYINKAQSIYPTLSYSLTVLLVGIGLLALIIIFCMKSNPLANQEDVQ